MGYTHYWRNPIGFTDEQWVQIMKGAQALVEICQLQGVLLAGGHGKGKPEIKGDRVCFNGYEDDSYETFELVRAGKDFDFCKTARNEYDPAVVAMLIFAASVSAHFEWSSDGEGEELDDGKRLAEQIADTLAEAA